MVLVKRAENRKTTDAGERLSSFLCLLDMKYDALTCAGPGNDEDDDGTTSW